MSLSLLHCHTCIILYCTVLYCTVLYCTVLYCPRLSNTLKTILITYGVNIETITYFHRPNTFKRVSQFRAEYQIYSTATPSKLTRRKNLTRYRVTITLKPRSNRQKYTHTSVDFSCTCLNSEFRDTFCKHIVYLILTKVTCK